MINRWNGLARFALMHSMATSLFFWFWSVRNETVDSLHHRHLLRDHQPHYRATTREDIAMMPYLMNLSAADGGGIGQYVVLGPSAVFVSPATSVFPFRKL